jgi:hypothetical protein
VREPGTDVRADALRVQAGRRLRRERADEARRQDKACAEEHANHSLHVLNSFPFNDVRDHISMAKMSAGRA